MKTEVLVSISVEGEIKVEVKGLPGPGCKDLTRQLEAALGDTVGDKKTREFHQAGKAVNRQRSHA